MRFSFIVSCFIIESLAFGSGYSPVLLKLPVLTEPRVGTILHHTPGNSEVLVGIKVTIGLRKSGCPLEYAGHEMGAHGSYTEFNLKASVDPIYQFAPQLCDPRFSRNSEVLLTQRIATRGQTFLSSIFVLFVQTSPSSLEYKRYRMDVDVLANTVTFTHLPW